MEFSVDLLELRIDDGVALRLCAVGLVVFLVVVLRGPEPIQRLHGGHDGRAVLTRTVEPFDELTCGIPLSVIGIEDHRTILRTDVVALPIGRRRVVRREEHVQQIVIPDLRGIELESDDLHMPGRPTGNLLIGRMLDVSPGVARLDVEHAPETAEHRLGAPEAPTSEYRGLRHIARIAYSEKAPPHVRGLGSPSLELELGAAGHRERGRDGTVVSSARPHPVAVEAQALLLPKTLGGGIHPPHTAVVSLPTRSLLHRHGYRS